MSKEQGKSRKSLVVGIIAAVVVLAALLVVLLTQCTGQEAAPTTVAPTTETVETLETYDLYWNLDRKLYDGLSEAGMSSRMPEEDGYFHVRFLYNGEIVTLKVADRKTVNALEVKDLMGLEFDNNGIVTGVIPVSELPCEEVAWQFYVQSIGGKLLKTNSSATLNGMEVMIDITENTGIWDMTGLSGEIGCEATPIPYDRILAIGNKAGEVTHIFIYERSEYMRTHEAECEHCKKTVEWSEWTKTNALPNRSGHFQLMNDITGVGQHSMPEDAKICLDLNGKRVDGKDNARIYSLHNVGTELAIMDSSEEQTGRLVAHGKGDQGMCVWLRYGVFYFYGGILDGSQASTIKNGTTVALQANTFMYMYGGEIIGGTSLYVKNDAGKYSQGLGGSMMLAGKSKFVMYDGIIRDGKAQGLVTKWDANGQPSAYERGYGGNIFMSSGAVMEMHGGTIKNGTAVNAGGNIHMDGSAELTIHGGTIDGGKLTGKGKNGGNIFVAGKATLTINGGKIVNGSSRNCAGNVYTNGLVTMNAGYIGGGKIINWSDGKLNKTAASRNLFIVNGGNFVMYGGSIDGGVQAIDTDAKTKDTRVYLSGYATINSTTAPNLTLSIGGSGITTRVGSLHDSAKIGVATADGLFTQPTKESNVDNFYSELEGADIVYYDGRIGLGRVNCLCGKTEEHALGCEGEQLFWGAWNKADSLPTTTGNFYLLKDVKCGQQNVAADAVINLDLNGKRVDGNNNSRIYSMHYRVENVDGDGKTTYAYPAHLTITDTSEGQTGVMASHGTANHQGSIAWLRYGDVTLLAGTFDASDYKAYSNWNAGNDGKFGTADDYETPISGMAFSIPSGRTMTMYGGTIIGGETIAKEQTKTNTIPVPEDAPEGTEPTVEELTKTISAGHGGAVEMTGTFYMYGGTIRDGISGNAGGNVRISTGGKMFMYGGEILNGTTLVNNGGNVQVTGQMEIHGGTIADGWSKNVAGNIHVSGKLTIAGGHITGGKVGASGNATADDANVYSVNGTLYLRGGVVDGYVRVLNYQITDAAKGAKTYISGNPVISGGKVDVVLTYIGGTGYISEMPTIVVDGPMTEGAKIEINQSVTDMDFAAGGDYTVTADDAKAFYYNGTETTAVVDTDNNSLFFGRYNCLCGKQEHTFGCQQVNEGKQMKWRAWFASTSLPTMGNFYLMYDVNGSGSTTVASGKTLNLDLNGKTVNWKYRAYRIYDASAVAKSTLTMTNTAATEGTIRAVEYTGVDQGCAVWVASGEQGVFNLLDGVVLDGSKYTVKNVPSESNGAGTTAEKNGGVVAVQTGGTFNMYGGKIIGAKAIRSEEITLSNGNKYSSWAPNGAAVAITSGTANMYGGEITGGRTENQGGNLLISGGKFNMMGGVISNGHADNTGGNVFVHRSGQLLMSGDARIENGTSAKYAGSILVDGIMTMTDNAVVTGGESKGGSSGNICVNFMTSGGVTYYGKLTMSGNASVTDGKATSTAGNIGVLSGTTMTMTDNASVSGGKAGTQGGNIAVNSNASLTMSGNATVSGGEALGSDGSGGNFFVSGANAKLVMTDNATVKDGKTTYYGGNIYVYNGATAEIKGNAVVSGGTVMGNGKNTEPTGGNIAIVNANTSVTLRENAKVVDGISYHTAGNVRISSNATLYLYDNAEISGGKSTDGKGDTTKTADELKTNANVFCVNGILEAHGGKITGNINVINTKANGSTIKLSGDPVITKGGSGYGLYTTGSGADPSLIQIVGAMTGEVESVVMGIKTGSGLLGTGSDYTITEQDAKVFVSDQMGAAAGCYILLKDNQLIVGSGDCLCGQEVHTKACLELWNGEDRIWSPWTSTTSLPTTTGNYYLTANVDFDWQQKNTANSNVVIDLNGYTVTNDNGQRMFSNWEAGTSLTITDKSEAQTGKLVASGDAVDQGTIWVRYGTFNLVAGTIDASGLNLKNVWNTTKNAVDEKNGGAVWVSGGATFNMYGGTIIGANLVTSSTTVNSATQSIYAPKGGAICSEGTTNIYDGIIRDGKSAGECGNVYVRGTFTMYGGQILDGTGGNAGNVIVHADGTMILKEGAVISGGEALTGTGGNAKISGKLIIDGGEIKDGVSKGNGGNIHITSTGTVELKAGTISNGWGKNVTGNVHIDGAKFIMTGGTVSGGKTGSTGVTDSTHANVQSVNGTWEFLGGTVEGNAMVFNYDVNQSGYTKTVVGGNATLTGKLYLNHSDGKAAPVITVNDDFAGNINLYTKSGGVFTANAVTEAQAKCFTSAQADGQIIRLTADHGAADADIGKLYFGRYNCVCGASLTGGSHYAAVCDGTSHLWKPTTAIFNTNALGADQYYYLTTDYSTSTVSSLTELHNVTYDLRGHQIKVTGDRLIRTYKSGTNTATVNITLTNTGAVRTDGNLVSVAAGDEGQFVWLFGSNKHLKMYNLKLDLSAASVRMTNTNCKDGLAVAVQGSSNSAKLYKVTSVGGKSWSNGNFLSITGSSNMAVLQDCTITGGEVFRNADKGGYGGVIYLGTGELTLNNTTITGGKAEKGGGTIWVNTGTKLIVSGNTVVTGGTLTTGRPETINVNGTGTIQVSSLGANASIGISGALQKVVSTTATYDQTYNNFFIDKNDTQKLAYTADGMVIAAAADHIHCVCGGTIANGTKLADGTYHYCQDIVYTAMNQTEGTVSGNKNWYLAEDKLVTGQISTAQHTVNICLNGHNLTAGENLNARMLRTYNADTSTGKGKFTVTTCQADKFEGETLLNNRIAQDDETLSDNGDGGVFWLTSSGTLELYAGTIDASMYTLKPNASDSPKHGTAIKVEGGATFKMFGGTVVGGKTLKGTSNNSEGACIFSTGNIIMNGGTIIGGETVGSGGAMFLYDGAITKIYGGTIKNGKAGSNGGNIFHGGKELLIAGGSIEGGTAGNRGGNVYFGTAGGTISGGTISAGVAKDGGNVANNTGITFNMTGGTITGGNCTSAGGNVWLMGLMKMSGGVIEKGTSKGNGAHTGANVNMNGSGSVEMTGGTIKGRICTAVSGAKLKLSGSAKIYDTDTSNNLYILGFNITIGQLNSDAKIGMLILKNEQVGATVATVADGVTLDMAQFPVHDLELTNSSTRSFKAVQEGTALKIVEVQ